jgi:hypothetical protein
MRGELFNKSIIILNTKFMKNFFQKMGLLLVFGLLISGMQTASSETTIICPSGDTFTCYTTAEGFKAYKGEGDAKVIIK